MDATPSRVLIIDDHQMFAQSLARLINQEHDLEVVASAFTAAEALDLAPSTPVDLFVVDYQLPDSDGATLTKQLRALQPTAHVLLLTGVDRASTADAALDAGCDAFITKDRAAHDLVALIRKILRGDHHISDDIAAAIRERDAIVQSFNLTAREFQVLQLLANGASTVEIREQMNISNNTVRTHVQRIIQKLDAHSKLEAVAIARESGLL